MNQFTYVVRIKDDGPTAIDPIDSKVMTLDEKKDALLRLPNSLELYLSDPQAKVVASALQPHTKYDMVRTIVITTDAHESTINTEVKGCLDSHGLILAAES